MKKGSSLLEEVPLEGHETTKVWRVRKPERTADVGASLAARYFERQPFVAITDYDDTFATAEGDDRTQTAVFHPLVVDAIGRVTGMPSCRHFAVVTARSAIRGDERPIARAAALLPIREDLGRSVRMLATEEDEKDDDAVAAAKDRHVAAVVGEAAREGEPPASVWRIGDTMWDVCGPDLYKDVQAAVESHVRDRGGEIGDSGYLVICEPAEGRGSSVGVFLTGPRTRDVVHVYPEEDSPERIEGGVVHLGGGG